MVCRFGGLTLILGAVYMLRLYQKTMLGTTSERTASFVDISGVELYTLIIISGLIIYLGIFQIAYCIFLQLHWMYWLHSLEDNFRLKLYE